MPALLLLCRAQRSSHSTFAQPNAEAEKQQSGDSLIYSAISLYRGCIHWPVTPWDMPDVVSFCRHLCAVTCG